MLQSDGRLASCRVESIATISGDSDGNSVTKAHERTGPRPKRRACEGGGDAVILGALG